jgi:glutamine synthetase
MHPLGWPDNGYPDKKRSFYCSIGNTKAFGRIIADVHYNACLYAGIKISGTNAEAMPG